MGRYLEAYAVSTAGVVDDKTLFDAAGINRKTAMAYDRLLNNLFVIESLPAWTSNRLKRLVLGPKRHLVDAGLAGAVMRLDKEFLAGIVLHTGPRTFPLSDRIVAAPISAIWG